MIRKLSVGAVLCFVVFLAFGQPVLSGRVTSSAGNPLEGANVWLLENRQGSFTDTQGRFRLEGIRPGSYTLQVSYLGYSTYSKVLEWTGGEQEIPIVLEEYSYQVDELVVRGTRAERASPLTYLNLDRAQIQANNLGQDLPFLLQFTPSVVVTSDAGTGVGYTGLRIRGTDPTRINITINGIPLNDAESQSVYWVNLPDFSSSISDVQIQRGVGSSTNGAGAFGASIHLNTSRVNHNAYAGLNTSFGSFQTWKRNLEFGTGLLAGNFTIDGRLSRISSDGYIDRSSADLNAYYLSAAYVGNRSLLRFNVFSGHEITYQAWYGVPGTLVDDWNTRTFNPAGMEKPGEPYDKEEDNYRQTHYQLLYNQQLNPNWNLNLALHYTLGGGYYEQYKSDQVFSDYGLNPVLKDGEIIPTDLVRRLWLDNDFYGGVFSLHRAGRLLDLTIGGAVHRYEGRHFGELVWMEYASNSQPGDRYYENDALKNDANLYAKAMVPFGSGWNAYGDLQFRRVGYTFLGFDQEANNVEQDDQLNFFNPKIGLSFSPDARQSWYASFAVAQREPNRDDYVQSTPGSRPRPEQLFDTELGYRLQASKSSLELTSYFMSYKDQLVLNGQINHVGAYTRVNVERSYRLGIEAAGGWEISRRWQVQANAAISQNKVKEFQEYLDDYSTDPASQMVVWNGQQTRVHKNTDLAFSPAVVAGLECTFLPFQGASWMKNQEWELSWMSRYISRQFVDNTSDPDNTIDPYSFSNLRVRYAWKSPSWGEFELTFLLQNLFHARYETNAWSYRYLYEGQTALDQGFFPQAGRNFLLGLSVRW